MSLWTPLHQAAYLGAPIEVVQQMIRAGAFSTNQIFANEPIAHRLQELSALHGLWTRTHCLTKT